MNIQSRMSLIGHLFISGGDAKTKALSFSPLSTRIISLLLMTIALMAGGLND